VGDIVDFPVSESRSFSVLAPAGTYRDFKAECARQGVTMGSVMRKLMALWLKGEVKTAIAAAMLLIGTNAAQAGEDQRLTVPGATVTGGAVRFDVPLCIVSFEEETSGGHHSVTVDAAGKLRADSISAKSVIVVGLLGRDACPLHSVFFNVAQATTWSEDEGEAH